VLEFVTPNRSCRGRAAGLKSIGQSEFFEVFLFPREATASVFEICLRPRQPIEESFALFGFLRRDFCCRGRFSGLRWPRCFILSGFCGRKRAINIQSLKLENFIVVRHHLGRLPDLSRQNKAVNREREHYVGPSAQN
jgi:hypothetical protein